MRLIKGQLYIHDFEINVCDCPFYNFDLIVGVYIDDLEVEGSHLVVGSEVFRVEHRLVELKEQIPLGIDIYDLH